MTLLLYQWLLVLIECSQLSKHNSTACRTDLLDFKKIVVVLKDILFM